jgi:predicted extracellular nuclease
MKKIAFTLFIAALMVTGLTAQNLKIYKSDGSIINVPLNSIDSITFADEGPVSSFILMNEIYSRGTAENPDWIEIYNDSDVAVDLSGYKIYDSGGQSGSKPKKEFPAGTIIPSKGFFVIVTDDDDPSGFGLSSGGEEVWLENADGTLIDNIVFPAMSETQSYGRFPDGSANLQLLETLTPGAANVSGGSTSYIILMNEIYSRGTAEDPDWIEIYNDSDVAVNLTGYKIYDSGGQSGTKPKKEFPSGTIIPSKGFFVIVTDDNSSSAFGLSSGGEEVWLEKADGTVIDNVIFPAMSETQSYGRKPDGSINWQLLGTITRGTSNNNAGTDK